MRVYLLQARAWSRSDLQKVFFKKPLLYYCGLGSGHCQDNVIFEAKSILPQFIACSASEMPCIAFCPLWWYLIPYIALRSFTRLSVPSACVCRFCSGITAQKSRPLLSEKYGSGLVISDLSVLLRVFFPEVRVSSILCQSESWSCPFPFLLLQAA